VKPVEDLTIWICVMYVDACRRPEKAEKTSKNKKNYEYHVLA
jgi:hypothetical protein